MPSMFRWWEVRDRVPQSGVDIIVGMMVPQARDGSCSNILRSVVRRCADLYSRSVAGRIVYSNRFTANGSNLALTAKEEAVHSGVPATAIVIPKNPWHPRIRNTVEEARFALRLLRLSSVGAPRLLVVANHLHMRRVLATFRALLPQGRPVELYWISVAGRGAYGSDAAQDRFRNPRLFLAYEVIAYLYSKIRGWA